LFELADIINIHPFSLEKKEKAEIYLHALINLTKYHYERCLEYKRIIDALGYVPDQVKSIQDIPFIPVRLFKEYELISVDKSQIVKTMTSSGTLGQRVSKILLDKDTSTNQTKTLAKLICSYIGKKRLPMLVIDTKKVIEDRYHFSARGAGILGFSMFGYDVTYALNDKMKADIELIKTFIEKYKEEKILIFGFTFIIWEYFYRSLKTAGIKLSLDKGIMIHGGGWKKMAEKSVDNDTFKESISDVSGITNIYNFYGMVEQTGSIFLECEVGRLHASNFSEVLIRDHRDFSILPSGQEGLVQLFSLLPLSYPGHSILSEDKGVILGEDDCQCGRKGKYFKILGRIKNAELKGCSDTHASEA
jgi:phenylacetate-coenzyme A ligase PaaK-like adenylate-forming protein